MLKFGFGQDVGIDLGTATVIVYIKEKRNSTKRTISSSSR